MTRRRFETADALVKAALAHPRPVVINDLYEDGIEFVADDWTSFVISKEDFINTCRDGTRAQYLAASLKTQDMRKEYCHSLNYGKPDWGSAEAEVEKAPPIVPGRNMAKKITLASLAKTISDEIVAAPVGGDLVKQRAPISKGTGATEEKLSKVISLKFTNGQEFKLQLWEVDNDTTNT